MEPIVLLNQASLAMFLELVKSQTDNDCIYEVRFAIDEGGLKVKFNNYGWSPALGTIER